MTSITDELREYAEDWDWLDTGAERAQDRIEAIADRIDAEHERQLEVLYRDMSDAEYVKLHKDTGGEYIHEYDKVDWRDHAGTWHENSTVVALCNDGCYVMYALDGMVIHVNKSDIRHHHAPTVEDVLRDFARECLTYTTCVDDHEVQDAIEMYAAKLRLAGDAE